MEIEKFKKQPQTVPEIDSLLRVTCVVEVILAWTAIASICLDNFCYCRDCFPGPRLHLYFGCNFETEGSNSGAVNGIIVIFFPLTFLTIAPHIV